MGVGGRGTNKGGKSPEAVAVGQVRKWAEGLRLHISIWGFLEVKGLHGWTWRSTSSQRQGRVEMSRPGSAGAHRGPSAQSSCPITAESL